MHALIVVDQYELFKTPLWEITGVRYKELRIACKVITGYKFDNNHFKLSDSCGNLYSFMVHQSDAKIGSKYRMDMEKLLGPLDSLENYYSINLWDLRGVTTLCKTLHFKAQGKDCIPLNIQAEIGKVFINFQSGKTKCSDCGELMDKHAGRYFAGVYCKECWEGSKGQYKGQGGWKYIESKETYN